MNACRVWLICISVLVFNLRASPKDSTWTLSPAAFSASEETRVSKLFSFLRMVLRPFATSSQSVSEPSSRPWPVMMLEDDILVESVVCSVSPNFKYTCFRHTVTALVRFPALLEQDVLAIACCNDASGGGARSRRGLRDALLASWGTFGSCLQAKWSSNC